MSLNIDTFTNRNWRPGNNFGGNTLFKALGHPLAAVKARALVAEIARKGSVAVYDPLGEAGAQSILGSVRGLELIEDLSSFTRALRSTTAAPV